MRIKIAVEPLNDNLPQSEHKALKVERVEFRGEIANTVSVDTVLCDGKDVVFTVADGGQLILTTPAGHEEVVYDAGQGATIRKSQQFNDEGRADRASEQVELKREQRPVDPVTGETLDPNVGAQVGSQGQDTRSPAERQAGQPDLVPPGGRVTQPTAAQIAEKQAAEAAAKKASDDVAKAKEAKEAEEKRLKAAEMAKQSGQGTPPPAGQKG